MKRLIIYYFIFLLSIFSLLSSGVIDSQDGFQYLAVARNIYYKGEPTAPVYEYDTRKNVHMSTFLGKDGKTYSPTGLGYSLAMLPGVAITDIVYKIYGVSPPTHFPLENDWLIFLTASFTNAFFGAILGVILLLYLLSLGLSKKQAMLISIVGLFSTNLLIYTKHSFPHMMFTSFLFLSFFLIKKHFQTKKKLFLISAGLSFGVVSITYNQTFMLAIIPLAIYFLLLLKFRLNILALKFLFSKFLIFFLGFLPFVIIYFWFENLKAGSSQNLANPLDLASYTINPLKNLPVTVFFEGLYGQLFSPGRSIFIYSPILFIIIFFWHKIKKAIFPEIFTFLLLSIIYILFYASQYRVGGLDQGLAGLWHGENSWGPRYLTPLLPLGMLVIGQIYTSLSKNLKLFIFYPLVIIGLYIQLLGLLIPYQTKLFNLQEKFFLNGTEYPAAVYSNFLPRYTPILTMSKNFVKLVQDFPKTLDHSIYDVKFYDGIDLPFNVGPERWRVIEGRGYISFDNNPNNPVKDLAFGVINHPLLESSESAKLQFILNDKPVLNKKPYQLNVAQREIIKIKLKEDLIKPKRNKLAIEVDYGKPTVVKKGLQILGLQFFEINGQRVNMESINVPYVSSLGPPIMSIKYENWGGENSDPWKLWDIHTQMYERLPDFWWIRNLYYYDIPRMPIFFLLSSMILISIYTGVKIVNLSTRKK